MIIEEASSNNTIGGTTAAARNVVSGNGLRGIDIFASSNNLVQGNLIGTDVSGTAALGNGFPGILLSDAHQNTIGGTAAGARNVISANNNGVFMLLASTGNVVQGNYIGTDVSGTVDLGNSPGDGVMITETSSNNTIGGTAAAARNVISGNDDEGVQIGDATLGSATNNLVQGNLIGTDVSGTIALGNGTGASFGDGVLIVEGSSANTIGGATPGARNVISANTARGVGIFSGANNNVVRGNYIGTDVSGTVDLGNTFSGVVVNAAFQNSIGGAAAGSGNRIMGNDEAGVVIVDVGGTANAILRNSIFDNTQGIDLANDGVTPNDAGDPDPGPNNLQNFPVLALADATPAGITIDGSLNSIASTTFRVEFFTSTSCNASGNGEGERFLDFSGETTDAGGNVSFSVALAAPVSHGDAITATATDPANNTSEFSACFTATCNTLVVLGQTVRALNNNILQWPAPAAVRFVKGDLAAVSGYSSTGDGTLFGATTLDISVDNPGSGDGMYYLVRPLGCGSWQTTPGNEPPRDGALP